MMDVAEPGTETDSGGGAGRGAVDGKLSSSKYKGTASTLASTLASAPGWSGRKWRCVALLLESSACILPNASTAYPADAAAAASAKSGVPLPQHPRSRFVATT
jgi:hypothetical protein